MEQHSGKTLTLTAMNASGDKAVRMVRNGRQITPVIEPICLNEEPVRNINRIMEMIAPGRFVVLARFLRYH